MSHSVKKSVSWATDESFAQIREYYFYDPNTGEELSGQAARDQAKIEVLGSCWRETFRIMRICKTVLPHTTKARELFHRAEKQALTLKEPCLFIIGSQWRHCGGRSQRPEEGTSDNILYSTPDNDTINLSSDESSESDAEGTEAERKKIREWSDEDIEWEFIARPSSSTSLCNCLGDTTPETWAAMSARIAASIVNSIKLHSITEQQSINETDTCDVPLCWEEDDINTIKPIKVATDYYTTIRN